MQAPTEIKVEYCVFDKSLCYACLSSDRELNVLDELSEIFRQIAWHVEADMYFCWECRSVLEKVKSFQERVTKAQGILKNHVDSKKPPKSLSNLLILPPTIDSIDVQENYEIPQNEAPQEQITTEEMKIEPDIDIQDNFANFHDEDIEESNPNMNETNDTINKSKETNNLTDKPEEWFVKYKKRYRIMQRNLDHTFQRIHIDVDEISTWLDKERNSMYYKRLKNTCDICVSTIGKERLNDHYRKCHTKSKSKPYFCKICRQYFASKWTSQRHINMHRYYYLCHICGYECYSRLHMFSHMQLHSRIVECLQCQATFVTTRQFYNHYKRSHEACSCEHCNEQFENKIALEKHACSSGRVIEASNSSSARSKRNYIPRQCPVCLKVYARSASMRDHYNKMHSESAKIQCQECGQILLNLSKLRYHIKYVHQGIERERKHICEVCERAFPNNSALKKHSRIHTGEKPYPCPLCGLRFSERYLMVNHVKMTHEVKVKVKVNSAAEKIKSHDSSSDSSSDNVSVVSRPSTND